MILFALILTGAQFATNPFCSYQYAVSEHQPDVNPAHVMSQVVLPPDQLPLSITISWNPQTNVSMWEVAWNPTNPAGPFQALVCSTTNSISIPVTNFVPSCLYYDSNNIPQGSYTNAQGFFMVRAMDGMSGNFLFERNDSNWPYSPWATK